MKIKKTCQYCGKEYFVSESQKERSKFCSDDCFRKSKNKRIYYKCDYCGKIFKVRYDKYKKVMDNPNKQLFCSSDCAKNAQKPKWDDIVSLFEQRGYILVSNEYVNARTKLEYICPKHLEFGSQYITYNNLKNGYGCKYCGIERTADSKRLSFKDVKKVFEEHDMILLPQEYKNSSTPMAYICRYHKEVGIQYMALSNAYKQHCPYCHIVKGEDKIYHYLLNNNIQFERSKSYEDLRGIGGGKLSYDFYLPNFNLLIEYQGEQHEQPVDLFGGKEQFQIQQEHDKRKREYAQEHNIELLEIWYYEFPKIEEILNEKFLLIA